ncbi:Electron transfer flavoprotein alpha/beta- subunit [Desulfofarcimen acetoxidans DSM 771]|uniref:Electron transfer flavoprotein small subunit n=1 Tax=Desulfofarcimen acetoxidans (strain ATCC 49208 / DSM 771 / KCTC 5769 / VKM B-1644 / 5575) TaxID=485916 RepID=C8VY92_DESAS|nr:electron transfer flavoprotein subunit beta/FixA family protein [Desulfofarcimen acetoxidans]ACV62773.1 Electron transfer flavoprotein alpha/beta- subunit [Desulfofarcimen acetoxidans DSM 771]
MHIIVCVKQVPDATEVRIDPQSNTLDRSSVPAIINPYDSHAVEEAVRLKDKFGGKVTVISMGPLKAAEVIKRSIALGADEGYLLNDKMFAGSDTLATSYILYRGIQQVCSREPFDLIFCGKQAVDGDTAQVGPGIARRLSIPQLTYVQKILAVAPDSKDIKIKRKLNDGYEIVTSKLPCLLTVEKEINELSYSSLTNMLRGARYQPKILSAVDIEAEHAMLGLNGSPTSVIKIFAPSPRNQGEIFQGDERSVINGLIEKLHYRLMQ